MNVSPQTDAVRRGLGMMKLRKDMKEQQHPASGDVELSKEEWQELRSHLHTFRNKQGRGSVSAATMKQEMARYMETLRQQEKQRETTPMTPTTRKNVQKLSDAVGKLFPIGTTRREAVRDPDAPIFARRPSDDGMATTYDDFLPPPPIHQSDSLDLHDSGLLSSSPPADAKKKHKKSKKKNRLMKGLADEKVAKEDRFKNRKKRHEILAAKLAEMGAQDDEDSASQVTASTDSRGSSMGLSSELESSFPQAAVSSLLGEASDDENFVDGLAYFASSSEGEIRHNLLGDQN